MYAEYIQYDIKKVYHGQDVYKRQLLGSIGPGGSVSASLEAPSCLVRVECGVYSRELILGQDSALQVSWSLNPPEMIVSHTKK